MLWTAWGLVALVAALAVVLAVTWNGLTTGSSSSGLTLGAGQGCLFMGRVPALAGKGHAAWAGIYPVWRFRWHTYPEGGWGLFVPIWVVMALAAGAAGLLFRAVSRGRR